MRRDFPARIKAEAFRRSNGHCEHCTRKLFTGDIFYDHVIPDQLNGGPVLDNCQVLCRSCHRAKTLDRDLPDIVRARKIERAHLGIKKPSTFRGWKRMDGTPVFARERER